jgi:hypothetical protein
VTLSCDFSYVTFCQRLFVLWLTVLHWQMKSRPNIHRLGHTKFSSCSSDCVLKTLERASDLKMLIYFSFFVWLSFLMSEMYNIMRKYNSYIFHVFSEARDHILIWNILFFNKLRQIIPEIRCERRDLLIFIFILKTTGTFTPVHSAGYLILRNELRSTQEVARQNIQVSFYIRSTGLWH